MIRHFLTPPVTAGEGNRSVFVTPLLYLLEISSQNKRSKSLPNALRGFPMVGPCLSNYEFCWFGFGLVFLVSI